MAKFILIFWIVCFSILQTCLSGGNEADPHPLDPLTSDEIRYTVEVIYATRPDIQRFGTWTFNLITLKEPDKSLILPYFLHNLDSPSSYNQIPRRSLAVLNEKTANIISEVVVNINTRVVESWKEIPRGTQATYTLEEITDAERIAKSDPEVKERCRQMGWVDMDLVVSEFWSHGYVEDQVVLRNAIRPALLYMFGKLFEQDNHFAHPFDFTVSVDLASGKVIAINNLPTHSDYDANNRNGNVCPKIPANYKPELLPANFHRKDVHPILFTQPGGAGYTVRGNEITWQKFKFRLGFNAREGMVIHHLSYLDGSERRPLIYRMSVAEIFVPYGDPRPPFHQKFPFDETEFTIGDSAVDLRAAKLCRGGSVAYLDPYLNDDRGNPVLFSGAVCIYEEDAGILWAHYGRDEKVDHTRSTRLVLTIFSSLGNYDYKFSWRFYQDATIELQTELHGILMSHLLAQNVTNPGGFGTVVFPQHSGQYHQHVIGLRIDTEIDGNINAVSSVDIVPLPDPSGTPRNPYGQGFTTNEKVLTTPLEARTRISPMTGRTWLIKNPNKIHPFTKKPVAWKLLPYNAPLPFVRAESPLHRISAFTDYNVWVTKYKEDQLYPAGFYLNGTGLPEWVNEDPNLDITQTDVVLWYIYGFTHIPRVEDFPVMPVESSGFFLKPANFFTGNPALDVPPPPEKSKPTRRPS